MGASRRHRRRVRTGRLVAATLLTDVDAFDRFGWCDCPASFIPGGPGFHAVLERWHRHDCPVLAELKRGNP